MKEKEQIELFNFLSKNKIENFVGVPDSTLKHFISRGLELKKLLISTREEEAIGIATGMTLAGSNSLVFMQNAGFGNSISTITSLVQMYKIPLILLIGWRGYLSSDAPEHVLFGKIQPDLLKLLGIKSKILDSKTWKKSAKWAIDNVEKGNLCALVIRREFHD